MANDFSMRVRELEADGDALRARREELVVELMQTSTALSEARDEVRRLRGAIERHRAQTGHNLCWLNDLELWDALGDGPSTYPHDTVPPEDEFFMACRAFYASRFADVERRRAGG